MNAVIDSLRKEFSENADAKTRESGQRFFKEEITLYGLKAAFVRQVSKKYFQQVKQCSKHEIFALCEDLWKSRYVEESFVACDWSHNLRKKYVPDDFRTFERWVSVYIDNWASCDTFCNHTVGSFIEAYPEFLANLKEWALSDNRWMRRASAVSLIIPARKGRFLTDIFEIANILLKDGDDMVQKGYGWMLKVTSQSYEKEVFDFVFRNKQVMPRTALRYAIEKMPGDLKKKAMAK